MAQRRETTTRSSPRPRGGPRPRTRDKARRAKILAAARRLFREQGFHAVGIDDIGAAAGITGPGVYRHFSAKEELLIAALDEAAAALWRDLEVEEKEEASPGTVLAALLESHVRFAVENADLVELWYQEWRNLPDASRVAQRRIQRRYTERWVDVLVQWRPEVGDAQARVMVHAAFGLIHSVAQYDSPVPPEHLEATLAAMALAALGAGMPSRTRLRR